MKNVRVPPGHVVQLAQLAPLFRREERDQLIHGVAEDMVGRRDNGAGGSSDGEGGSNGDGLGGGRGLGNVGGGGDGDGGGEGRGEGGLGGGGGGLQTTTSAVSAIHNRVLSHTHGYAVIPLCT